MVLYFERHPFRRYAKLTVICKRLCQQSLHNLLLAWLKHEPVHFDLDQYFVHCTWRGLGFSTEDYKTNKQQCLKSSARQLLEKDPATRCQADIKLLLAALRNIIAVSENREKIQRKLCQLGRYQCFDRRRIIQRVGDPAQQVYFIISGTVLAVTSDDETGKSRTVTTLTAGMSFGELTVASNPRHRTTVCSKSSVELLVIAMHEYQDIIMSSCGNILSKVIQSQFIRRVGFLRHWPLEQLRGDVQNCSISFFNRNQVLVRDSNSSDNIYLVLQGSLSVIKILQPMEPGTSQKKQDGKRRLMLDPSLLNKTSLGLGRRSQRSLQCDFAESIPTTIELQVLERGQYFGVNYLLYSQQPSLCLVSNGAECLVLSKKMFLQMATENCLKHLRQTEYPYPSDSELYQKLQEIVAWQVTRAAVYQQTLQRARQKNDMKKFFHL